MQPDTYTKIVLTIIAACLVVLTARQLVAPDAYASEGVVRVDIVRINGHNVYGNSLPVDAKINHDP